MNISVLINTSTSSTKWSTIDGKHYRYYFKLLWFRFKFRRNLNLNNQSTLDYLMAWWQIGRSPVVTQFTDSSPLDKMTAISQTTFSNKFSWMKSFVFWLEFHLTLSLRVQLTISEHWFREWLGAEQVTSHYLNQCWSSSPTHTCSTKGGAGVLKAQSSKFSEWSQHHRL